MGTALAQAGHGDRAGALRRTASILRAHPDFVPAMKLDAMLHEDAGDAAAADKEYAAALQLAPADPDLLFKVGLAGLLHGDTPGAVTRLARYTALQPQDEEGFYYLAQSYHHAGQDEQALKAIRRASELAPASAPILQKFGELLCSTGENEKAMAMLAKAQKADASLPRINFDLAVASLGTMDLQAAERYASREAELRPDDLDNRELMASIEIKLSKWTEAQSNLQRVVEKRPSDASASLQLGQCAVELKQYDAAVAALRRALRLDPTQVLAHFFLAKAYAALGDTVQAQHEAALHREMLQHIPFALPKAEAQREEAVLAQARELLTRGEEEKALQLLKDKEPEATGKPGGAWVSLGITYLSMGRNGDAQRSFDKALQIDPTTPDAHAYLGVLAMQRNELPAAEIELQRQLDLDAGNSFALGEMGELRYRQGRWPEAITLLVRSKTTKPTLLYLLCDAYFRVGDTQKADLTAETLAAFGHAEPALLDALNNLLRSQGQVQLAARLQSKA